MVAAVTGGEQLRALGVRLRAAGDGGGQLRRRVRRNIVAAVKPMREDVRRHIDDIPTHGDKHTGLRKAMRDATRIRVATGARNTVVSLEVDRRKMPKGKANLPAYMDGKDGPFGRWRHPVYGNKTNWVTQESHPYFDAPVRAHLTNVREAVVAAVRETAREIEHGSPRIA